MPRIEGSRNLTERLTWHLTTSLTEYLTADLTESGVPRGRAAKQRGSGDGHEAVATFPLGGVEDFRDDGVMDSQPVRDHVLP